MGGPVFSKVDPVRQRLTEITRDAETGLPIIKSHQAPAAIQAILDANKRASNEHDHAALARKNPAGMVKVASIPGVIVAHLMQVGIWNDKPALMKWLCLPENLWLRTDGGRKL